LLQQRNKEPEKEYWSIPGGKVEFFEKIEDALKREIKEETGVDIEIVRLLGICNHIVDNEKIHYISPSYLCKIKSGEPKIMEPQKHIDMKWFPLDELPKNLTITTKTAIEDYFAIVGD
ncbi:MAG: NUDIX domain-containing protein, partial [Lachnospiraceae bacterium]|nr:NUDIX domain-containing protein [Lachnospiraceae bacterium]